MTTVEPIRDKNDIKKVKNILRKQSERDYVLFVLGINCGLRVSDILSLNIEDVRNKNYITLTEKKTGKYKKFPINPNLKTLIANFTYGKPLDEPLFKTVFGNRLCRISAYKIINTACNRARLNIKVGTHTMRKTFGYHHYKQFRDVAMLQMIFNHSSPQITLKYIGIDQDEIDKSYMNFSL